MFILYLKSKSKICLHERCKNQQSYNTRYTSKVISLYKEDVCFVIIFISIFSHTSQFVSFLMNSSYIVIFICTFNYAFHFYIFLLENTISHIDIYTFHHNCASLKVVVTLFLFELCPGKHDCLSRFKYSFQ